MSRKKRSLEEKKCNFVEMAKKKKRKICRAHKNGWLEMREAFLACQDTGKRVQ
jgi:hypothetical protein